MIRGPNRYVVSYVQDIKSAFEVFVTPSIETDIHETTNLEGKHMFRDGWKDLDVIYLQAFIGLLISAGVYHKL